MSDQHRGWLRCAAIGVAALIGMHGGLLAGVAFSVADIIDRMFGHLDARRRERARELCLRAETALHGHASRLDPETAESARLKTEGLLHSYGLTDEQFARLSLDAASAAEAVLSKGHFTPDERIEILPICRDLLRCFYQSLPDNTRLLSDLLPYIYRETLGRLDRLEISVAEIARWVQHLAWQSRLPEQPSPNLTPDEMKFLLYIYINESYAFIHSDSDELRCIRTGNFGQYWGFKYRPDAGEYESDSSGNWKFVPQKNPPGARSERLRWLAAFERLASLGLLVPDGNHSVLSDNGKRVVAERIAYLRDNFPDQIPRPRLDAIMLGLWG